MGTVIFLMNKCEYGHVHEETWWEFDARGIPLCKVCDNCQDERLAGYRPDVLEDPSYWADEPIEPETDIFGRDY